MDALRLLIEHPVVCLQVDVCRVQTIGVCRDDASALKSLSLSDHPGEQLADQSHRDDHVVHADGGALVFCVACAGRAVEQQLDTASLGGEHISLVSGDGGILHQLTEPLFIQVELAVAVLTQRLVVERGEVGE